MYKKKELLICRISFADEYKITDGWNELWMSAIKWNNIFNELDAFKIKSLFCIGRYLTEHMLQKS